MSLAERESFPSSIKEGRTVKKWEMVLSVSTIAGMMLLLTGTFWGRVAVLVGCGSCTIAGMAYGQSERRKALRR